MKEFKFRDKTYILNRTAHCFTLSLKGFNNKKNEETIQAIGYYTYLTDVCMALFHRHVLDKSETKSIIDCVKELKKELKVLLGE